MRLGHKKELQRIDAAETSVLSDAFFSIGDLLEEVEPLHKAGNDKMARALIDSCERIVNDGTVVMPDLNADTMRFSLFQRESEWGGNPLGLWGPAACAVVRCEHSVRLLQIRALDLFNDEDLLSQVEQVYTPEELRGSHG
jgi:hypothetical protein